MSNVSVCIQCGASFANANKILAGQGYMCPLCGDELVTGDEADVFVPCTTCDATGYVPAEVIE